MDYHTEASLVLAAGKRIGFISSFRRGGKTIPWRGHQESLIILVVIVAPVASNPTIGHTYLERLLQSKRQQ